MRVARRRLSDTSTPPRSDGLKDSSRTSPSPPGPVVLALFATGRPSSCLGWAARLARDTGSHLHVVRVLPEQEDVGCALGAHNTVAILRAVEHTLVSHRATCSWIRQLASPGNVPRRFSILRGEFTVQVARYVEEVEAQLLLLPFQGEGVSELVTCLSARTRIPVLVSRAPCTVQTIVAATDLRDSEFSVLRVAGDLGRRLDSELVAVHNLDPQPALADARARDAEDLLRNEPARAARLERLRRVAQPLFAAVQPVLRDDADPVGAILDEARARNAHLVVVGLRPGRRERFTSSVAGRVVDLAQQSVLVVPVAEGAEP